MLLFPFFCIETLDKDHPGTRDLGHPSKTAASYSVSFTGFQGYFNIYIMPPASWSDKINVRSWSGYYPETKSLLGLAASRAHTLERWQCKDSGEVTPVDCFHQTFPIPKEYLRHWIVVAKGRLLHSIDLGINRQTNTCRTIPISTTPILHSYKWFKYENWSVERDIVHSCPASL